MSNGLESPASPDDLYFARGPEVECFRPFMPGDVFRDLAIPGVDDEAGDEERLAMVVTHPCSMRQGSALATHLHAVRVRTSSRIIPPEKWTSGFFRIMPLPSLFHGRDTANYEGVFDTLGRIRGDALLHDRRVASLSHDGLALLQQRFVHHLTRVAVPKEQLLEQMVHVLDEVELQEEWARELLENLPPADLPARLQPEIETFDAFLGAEREGGKSYRDDLRDPATRAAVRRAIRAEIKRRQGDAGAVID